MTQQTNGTRWTVFQIIILLACTICFFGTPGCSGGSGDKFVGNWQSNAYAMTIAKDGDIFTVNVTRPSGWEGLQGKYAAKYEKGTLHFDTSILGEARLSSDGMTIYWHGGEWRKK